MKRPAKILLLLLVSLMIEPLGPSWEARNQSALLSQTGAARDAVDSKPHQSLTVTLDEGNFVLKDLRLLRMGSSTKLSGKLINQTKQRWDAVVFAVKAYDKSGRLLRGVEREMVFAFNGVGKGKSAPINSGHGVWLEGIPFNSIERLEVILLRDDLPAAHANRRTLSTEIEE